MSKKCRALLWRRIKVLIENVLMKNVLVKKDLEKNVLPVLKNAKRCVFPQACLVCYRDRVQQMTILDPR